MGVFFSLKRKTIPPCAARRNLEGNTLSKISQTQKGEYRTIYLQAALRVAKITQTEGRTEGARGWGVRGGGGCPGLGGTGVSVSWGGASALWDSQSDGMDGGDGYQQRECECVSHT